MKTMTIRNIPDEVAVWLSDTARERNASVNATMVALLTRAAFPEQHRKRRDLSQFCGRWSDKFADRFEAAVEDAFEQVNPEDWKVKV